MSKESNLNGKLTVQIKEGCEYKTQLTFRVQNELISGLKYKNTVAGASSGIVLLRVNEMLGSYGPDPQKTNVFVFPRREWEEGTRPTLEEARTPCRSALPAHPPVISQPDGLTHAGVPVLLANISSANPSLRTAPSGMMARGTYKCTTTFVDDDGTTHLTFNYKLVIAKDFL
jgi:hypothetical protein